jgi:hemerythrin-like metal-binding protein
MAGPIIIAWSSDMSVGVPSLDNDHRHLIAEINQLYAASISSNKEAVDNALAMLTAYSIRHFHNEESYMARIRYGRLEEHRKRHDEFTMKIREFAKRCEEGQHASVAKDMLEFLSLWLADHILHEDKEYASDASLR